MRRLFAMGLLLFSVVSAWADEENFPIGSLIIPMDAETQNLKEDGIFLAYGLIFELLGQGLTINVAINPTKDDEDDKNYPDIIFEGEKASDLISVVNGADYMPYALDAVEATWETEFPDAPMIYRGGPFIIHKDYAATVKKFLADNGNYDTVVIHELKTSKSVPIGVTYDEVPRKIALLQSVKGDLDYTADVLECYMELAGITSDYYDVLTQDEIAAGQLVVGTYYILWMPHWTVSEQDDISLANSVIEKIDEFLEAGGNVLATCTAIDSLGSTHDLVAETDLAINELDANLIPDDTRYDHHSLPFSQIGNYQFEVDPVDTQIFRPYRTGDTTTAEGHTNKISTWMTNTSIIAYKFDDGEVDEKDFETAPDENKWAYYAYREKDDNDNKGNIHYIAGHQYASCKPTLIPGNIYAMELTISQCDKKDPAFWAQTLPTVRITLDYTGDRQISLELSQDEYRDMEYTENGEHQGMAVTDEFFMWAEDPAENPDRFGANYGPGCSGGGASGGNSHLGAIYIQNRTTDSNMIINTITVEWSCNGFAGPNDGCGSGVDYQFEQFNISILDKENGKDACGRTSCLDCGDVYGGKKTCVSSGSFSFTPDPKSPKVSNLTFDGAVSSDDDGNPVVGNVGGLRYIYNTLFNKILNPITIAEFARSGPVIKNFTFTDDEGKQEEKLIAFFGTFEYPGNAGHLRAYEAVGSGTELTLLWDAQDGIPAYLDRDVFTVINGTKVPLDLSDSNAQKILDYIQDASVSLDDMKERIRSFLGKYRLKRMGGVERSTPAIVPPTDRISNGRTPMAYVGSTYGALEVIDITDGSEHTAYVPAGLLKNFENTGTSDANRPQVDGAPTVLDAYLQQDDGTRKWHTLLLVSHGSSEGGFSCLDITDPDNISVRWSKFDTIVPDPDNPPDDVEEYGLVHRVTVAQYIKTTKDDEGNEVLQAAWAAIVTASLTTDGEHGFTLTAYDLDDGSLLTNWAANPITFHYPSPVNNINDVPASAALWDSDGEGFDDIIFVGDMSGKLWKVSVTTGKYEEFNSSLSGTTPSGEARPIGATPSVGVFKGSAVVAYGTGGTNWSNATNNYVRVVDADTGSTVLQVDIGTKRIFSPIVIARDNIFFTAVEGTLGSSDPTLDIEKDGEETDFYRVYLDADDKVVTSKTVRDKTESSPYVAEGQVFTGGFEGEIKRYGTQTSQKAGDLFQYLVWRDLNAEGTVKGEEVGVTVKKGLSNPKSQ